MLAADFLQNTRSDISAAEGRSGSLTHSPQLFPRPDLHPPPVDHWDLAQFPPPAPSKQQYSRGRSMSLDYSGPVSAQVPHGMYGQADLDQTLNSLQNGEVASHHHMSGGLPHNGFDHAEGLDVPEHSGFDLFSSSPSANSFSSQRYRTNASSSSSLGPQYGMGGESLYPHSFSDSVPSFSGANPYDMSHSLPSSYSSGKISPLTPNDPMQQPSLFPSQGGMNGGGKEFPPHNGYSTLLTDRRTSNMSNTSYSTDYQDEFAMDGTNNNHSGMNFAHPAMPQYQERLGRYQPDNRFPQPLGSPTVPSHMHHNHGPDVLRGVAPQSTHYRPDISGFDDMHPYMAPSPTGDLSLRMPGVDETLARMKLQAGISSSNDLHTFIRPFLDQYVRANNRLAFGERTVIVMSSKVAQKSYGTEKRFLCPPPTAIMIGNSWWSDLVRRGEEPRSTPPRVVVSISGEPTAQDGSIEWTSASGKSFDQSDPPTGTTYIGRCVGKQLFISDVDEKKKKVEALVKISTPASDDGPERVIGTFPSRPIKVISKPSKKRQSAKNLELCINHGSTISLFHRLRSQTVSTKYLCVSGSNSSFKGSDGAPLLGIDQRSRSNTPSFIARTASWDPFVMYIVDVNKPAGGIDAPPPPPPQPDYPSPPPNAISFTTNGSQIPIYYNQTVVLQCLTSGVVSPVLIIRKVDHQTTAVGGGLQDGAKGVADHYCVPGEVCGDPVSQLHKIAFEVYDGNKGMPEPGTPGPTGAFLSCMGEKVNTYRPIDGRQWNSSLSMESNSPPLPSSPVVTTPVSTAGTEYFSSGTADGVPGSPSPTSADFLSNDGGRVKKQKRSTSSGSGAITKNPGPKGRRRPNSAGSASSGRRGSSHDSGASSGALWQVDIGETSVWTIVGTDQVRYNFFVPPVLFNNQNAPPTGSFPIPTAPVTPFPGVVKYLPPDRAAEAPKHHAAASRAVLSKPNPHAAKMLTIYGENFVKNDPVNVFFGSEPSPYVEIRCTEVLGCLPPDSQVIKRRPIILIRSDGVVFPSNTMYP